MELSLPLATPFASNPDFGDWLEIATLGFVLLISVNGGSAHQIPMASDCQLAMARADGNGFHTGVKTNEVKSQ